MKKYYLVIPYLSFAKEKYFDWMRQKLDGDPAQCRKFINEKFVCLCRNICLPNISLKISVFSTQFQCCLTFSLFELQMLLRYCLMHISIIILRHILYLLYLCPYQDVGLLISHLCDLFFIFLFITISLLFFDSYIYTCTVWTIT